MVSCTTCEQRETNREFAKVYFLIVILAILVNWALNEITQLRDDQQENARRIRQVNDSVGYLREQLWASGVDTDAQTKGNEEEVEPSDG